MSSSLIINNNKLASAFNTKKNHAIWQYKCDTSHNLTYIYDYMSSLPCIVNYHRLPGQKWLYRMTLPIVQLHWGWNIFEEDILNLNWNKFPAKSRPMCNEII